ncbi:hypothetical protein C8Q76DRAFT_729809 [Earliella scabrosa]|nr:hypothetical protein C8Q76DRAFT_729809 [Earliella scabrosa]
MANPPPFNKPSDFVAVRGRGGYYYCSLCKPPDRDQGQAMTLAAALRHEQQNEKHLKKVEEAYKNEWDYQADCDWGPTPLPVGTNAWEQSWPADRVKDFIQFWLENMERCERGKPMESMDTFIDRFNDKYREWAEGVQKEMEEWAKGQSEPEPEDEEPAEEWDGVQGYWYSGGSFDPREDGFNPHGVVPPTPIVPRSPESIAEDERKMWGYGVVVDPYVEWGVSPDEITPWSDAPAGAQQGSDATPRDSPPTTIATEKKSSQRVGKQGQARSQGRRRGGRGRKKGTIGDGAGRGADARRNPKKVY